MAKTPEAHARQIAGLRRGGKKGNRGSHGMVDLGLFCVTFLRNNSSISRTAKELHISKSSIYEFLRHPNCDERMEQARQMVMAEASKIAARKLILDRSHLDERLLRQLDKHKTHKVRGDQDYYSGVKIGYQSLQLIEAPKIIQNASANAGAQAGATAFEVYEPLWLRQKKAEWDKQLEQKHGLLSEPDPSPTVEG